MKSHTTPGVTRLMRSKLFVPGSRPALFEKAMSGAADILSFDLEDAVVPDKKSEARDSLSSFLRTAANPLGKLIIVRVNGLESEWFAQDIAALAGAGLNIINLPKVESGDQVREAAEAIAKAEAIANTGREISLLANIETPKGLRLALEIATASPRVMGLQIGFADFSLSCGIDRKEKSALNAVRLGVCFAVAEAGVAAFDGAFLDVNNPEDFRADAEDARRLGFIGKSCIHPSQVPIANEVFSPSAAEIARAESVLTAAAQKMQEGVGAFLHEGKMVDVPVIAKARAIVAQAALLRGVATEFGSSGGAQ